MLDYSIMEPQGILMLEPRTPISKEDFEGLSATVDGYLAQHAKLHGVLVHTREFPGYENFDGFIAHMHFVRKHHTQVERVAVVTDSVFASIAETLGKHFIAADVRHFPFADSRGRCSGYNANDRQRLSPKETTLPRHEVKETAS